MYTRLSAWRCWAENNHKLCRYQLRTVVSCTGLAQFLWEEEESSRDMSKSLNLPAILRRPETSYGTLIQVFLSQCTSWGFFYALSTFPPQNTSAINTIVILARASPKMQPLGLVIDNITMISVSITFLGSLGRKPLGQSLGLCLH